MQTKRWLDSLADFGRFFVPVVGVVVAWYTFDSWDIEWAFWACVVAAAAYAFIKRILPRAKAHIWKLREFIQNGRDYPDMKRAAGTYKAQLDDLESQMKRMERGLEESFVAGVSAGRKRALGEHYAGQCNANLEPTFMVYKEESLWFIVAVDPPEMMPATGSLWTLRIKTLRTKLATLAVVESFPDEGTAILSIDQVHDAPYMADLSAEARTATVPSSSLELTRRKYDSITELEEEA